MTARSTDARAGSPLVVRTAKTFGSRQVLREIDLHISGRPVCRGGRS